MASTEAGERGDTVRQSEVIVALQRRDLVIAVALGTAAAALRVGGLAPPSLWLDDAWVALVTLADGPAEVLRVSTTTPGFTALLKVVSLLVGFSELSMQAVPFVAGVAAAPSLYLLARRVGLGWHAGALAGLVLVLSPVHAQYSVAVKQYTLDALLTVALLGVAWRATRDRLPAGIWLLAACGAVATAMSASTAVVSAGLLAGVTTLTWSRGAVHRRHSLVASCAYGAFALAWWALALRPRLTDALHEYWAGFFLDSPADAGHALVNLVRGLLGVDGVGPTAVAAGLVVGALLLVARRRGDVAVLAGAPLAAAVAASVAGVVPLGTGRTDIVLYPLLALLLGVAADQVGRTSWVVAVTAVAAAGLLLVALPLRSVDYPQEVAAPLVRLVGQRMKPASRLLVLPDATWATALYGPWPVEFEPSAISATGFEVRFRDDRILPLRGTGRVPSQRVLGDAQDVWLIGQRYRMSRREAAGDALDARGLVRVRAWDEPGAFLERWVGSGAVGQR